MAAKFKMAAILRPRWRPPIVIRRPWTLQPGLKKTERSRDTESRTHLSHSSHDGEFLRGDEAFQHDADGHVDVILVHVITQMHASMRLRHADHRLDVTDRDGDTACRLGKNF